MFLETLYIITPNWKQPKCPFAGEWIGTRGISVQCAEGAN